MEKLIEGLFTFTEQTNVTLALLCNGYITFPVALPCLCVNKIAARMLKSVLCIVKSLNDNQ